MDNKSGDNVDFERVKLELFNLWISFNDGRLTKCNTVRIGKVSDGSDGGDSESGSGSEGSSRDSSSVNRNNVNVNVYDGIVSSSGITGIGINVPVTEELMSVMYHQ